MSVVIPAYGARETIDRSVDSLNRQTVEPLEIIIVDNEPDHQLEEFIPKTSSPLRVLRESGRGAGRARNLGLHSANGRYCGFLDSDDQWAPTFLERMRDAMSASPGACLYAGGAVVHSADGVKYTRPQRFGRGALTQLLLHNTVATSAAVVEASVARRCGGFWEEGAMAAGCEDWALWLKLLRVGRAVRVPDALAVRYEEAYGQRSRRRAELHRDMKLAVHHVFGAEASGREAAAAQAGIMLVCGSDALKRGFRREARRYCRAAVAAYPWSSWAWAWLALAHLPPRLEHLARSFAGEVVLREHSSV